MRLFFFVCPSSPSVALGEDGLPRVSVFPECHAHLGTWGRSPSPSAILPRVQHSGKIGFPECPIFGTRGSAWHSGKIASPVVRRGKDTRKEKHRSTCELLATQAAVGRSSSSRRPGGTARGASGSRAEQLLAAQAAVGRSSSLQGKRRPGRCSPPAARDVQGSRRRGRRPLRSRVARGRDRGTPLPPAGSLRHRSSQCRRRRGPTSPVSPVARFGAKTSPVRATRGIQATAAW
jgi:hypothetical protein